MGCDIHLFLEKKRRFSFKFFDNMVGKWTACDMSEYGYGCGIGFGDRWYPMFARLAGVRNYESYQHLPIRWIPSDASWDVKMLFCCKVVPDCEDDDWDNSIVSETNARQYIKEGISLPFCEKDGIKYITNPDYHTASWCTTEEMETCVKEEFSNEIHNGEPWFNLVDYMKQVESQGCDCRAIFWFDN